MGTYTDQKQLPNKKLLTNAINGPNCSSYIGCYISYRSSKKEAGCELMNKSPKAITYNYIDKLVSGESSDSNIYKDFKNFLSDYFRYSLDNHSDFFKIFSKYNKFCLAYNRKGELIERFTTFTNNDPFPYLNYINSNLEFLKETYQQNYNQVVTQISSFFVNKYNSSFITNSNKLLIESYASLVTGHNNDKEEIIKDPEAFLTEQLGEVFESYSKELNKLDQQKEFYDLINEVLAQLDTHKYSDKVVDCFINAFSIEDTHSLLKESSKCEYIAHIEYTAYNEAHNKKQEETLDTPAFSDPNETGAVVHSLIIGLGLFLMFCNYLYPHQ